MFRIIVISILTLFSRLNVRGYILFTCKKHLHDHIIPLRREVWVHKTSLTSPHVIKVPVPSQKSAQSCICVFNVLLMHLSANFAYSILELTGQCFFYWFFLGRGKRKLHMISRFRQYLLHYFLSIVLGMWCLTPLSIIFQLDRGCQRVTNKHHELHFINKDILYDCYSELLVDIKTTSCTNSCGRYSLLKYLTVYFL